MNETIKNLFVVSGGRVDGELTYTDEGFNPECFAKLIVCECSNLLRKRDARTEPAEYLYILKEFGITNEQTIKRVDD